MRVVHRLRCVTGLKGKNHAVKRKDAEKKRRTGPDRHKRIHVGRSVDKALCALPEKLEVKRHHGNREQELRQRRRHGAYPRIQKRGDGEPGHRTHGCRHQNHAQNNGGVKADFELPGFGVCRCLQLVFRTFGGLALFAAKGFVTRISHGFLNGRNHGIGFRVVNRADHAVFEQIDGNTLCSRDRLSGFFHARRTGCAAHAAHIKMNFLHRKSP